MGTDADTNIAELRSLVTQFIAAREWQGFQTPKNLSMSIAIEAAELMEHFQWLTQEQSCNVVNDPKQLNEVAHELADVIIYCLSLSHTLGIDLTNAIETKLVTSDERYPADVFRGQFRRPTRDKSVS